MKTLFLVTILLILIAIFSYEDNKPGQHEEVKLSDEE